MTKMTQRDDLLLKKFQEVAELIGAPPSVVEDAIKEIGFSKKDIANVNEIIHYILKHGDPKNAEAIAFATKKTEEYYVKATAPPKRSLWKRILMPFSKE